MANKGIIVLTKTGKKGIVYNKDNYINNKVPVHIEGEDNLLCEVSSLTIIGYID